MKESEAEIDRVYLVKCFVKGHPFLSMGFCMGFGIKRRTGWTVSNIQFFCADKPGDDKNECFFHGSDDIEILEIIDMTPSKEEWEPVEKRLNKESLNKLSRLNAISLLDILMKYGSKKN